jgi:hypothetical protein
MAGAEARSGHSETRPIMGDIRRISESLTYQD